MVISGCDYSFTRPDPVTLAAGGYRFAGRYVGPGTSGKHLTRGEAETLNRHGLKCVTLAEADEKGALGGLRAGKLHAASASLGAQSAGAPPNAPIFFAVDFQPTKAQLPIVGEYFRGVATVLHKDRIGAYGSFEVMAYLYSKDLIEWGFQTYAWSHGRWHPWAMLRQVHNHVEVGGGVIDQCQAMADSYGGWTVDEHLTTQGEDMLTDQEKIAFHFQRWRLWEIQCGHDPIVVPAWPDLGIEETREVNWGARTLRAIAAQLGLAELAGGDWTKRDIPDTGQSRGLPPVDLDGVSPIGDPLPGL